MFAAGGTTTCTETMSGLITDDLNVPAGAVCRLLGSEVAGNVTVQGSLFSYGTRFDKNVDVHGGVIVISNGNGMGSALFGNLTINGSSGNNQIGCPNISNEFLGNISFTGSTGTFNVCPANVKGNVIINNNTRVNLDYSGPYVADLNNIVSGKNITCEANASSNGDAPIKGSNDAAKQKLGQCAGL